MLPRIVLGVCASFFIFRDCLSVPRVLRTKRQENGNLTNEDVENVYLEIINECKCVLYYLCDEKGFIVSDGRGIIEERLDKHKKTKTRILCNGGKFRGEYVCCKEKLNEEVREPGTEIPVIREEKTTPTMTTPTKITPTATTPTPPTTETTTKKKKRPKCGSQLPIIDARVFAGEDELTPVIGEFPWIAALYRKLTDSNEFGFHASGSLIHPEVILTANHVVRSARASDIKISLNGEIELKSIGHSVETERNVREIIKHPDYNSGSLYNDVALLILDKPYDLTSRKHPINTICLISNTTHENKRCLVAGWGKTPVENEEVKILKKVELPTVEHSKCQELLRKTRLSNYFELDKSFMCAGGELNKDACKGDGGSPLMCPIGNGYMYQAGIVSWGIGCGQKDVPGIYADVSFLYDWIIQQLSQRQIFIEEKP